MMNEMDWEIDSLKQMARNWAEGFKTWLEPDGENDHVYQEFLDDMQLHLFPYVERLRSGGFMDEAQFSDLIDYFHEQIRELRDYADGMPIYRPNDMKGGEHEDKNK